MFHPVPTMRTRNIRPRRRYDVPSAAPAPRETPAAATAVTGREAVSATKLLAFINQEVQARPECAGVKVRAGAWRLDPYGDDANWNESSLVVQLTGLVTGATFRELGKVIERARARYDVLEPEAYLQ
jgi:hypothetical protein